MNSSRDSSTNFTIKFWVKTTISIMFIKYKIKKIIHICIYFVFILVFTAAAASRWLFISHHLCFGFLELSDGYFLKFQKCISLEQIWVKPAKFFFKQCLDNSGLQIANFSQMQSCCLPDFVVLQRESIFGLLGGLRVTIKISFHYAKIMEKFRAMIKQNSKALFSLYLKS